MRYLFAQREDWHVLGLGLATVRSILCMWEGEEGPRISLVDCHKHEVPED